MSSRAYPIMVNESTNSTIATPGGTIHHQYPENAAPAERLLQDRAPRELLALGSGRPRNESVVSVRIAIATMRMVFAKISGPRSAGCGA